MREPNPEPHLRPSSPATLFVAGLAAAALAWVLVGAFYGNLPKLTWLQSFPLALLAVLEAYLALTTGFKVRRRPGAGAFEPLVIARLAVLGKASALVGAVCVGGYAALSVWLWLPSGGLTAAHADLPAALFGAGAALALLVAALWLERSCRIPPAPKDIEEGRS